MSAVAGVSSTMRAVRSELAACLHAQALVHYDLAQWQQCLHSLSKKLATLQQLTQAAAAAANAPLHGSNSSTSVNHKQRKHALTPLEGTPNCNVLRARHLSHILCRSLLHCVSVALLAVML
jgi:hypothetical protein